MTNNERIILEIRQIAGALMRAPFNEDTIDLLHSASVLLWDYKQLMEEDILGEREGTQIPIAVIRECRESIRPFL